MSQWINFFLVVQQFLGHNFNKKIGNDAFMQMLGKNFNVLRNL